MRTDLLIAMACCLGTQIMGPARAASSLNAPLTSFDAANFTLASPNAVDAVVYDAAGAHFGTFLAGDAGRNFQRTIMDDFATVPFVAEITIELSTAIHDNGTPNDPGDDFPVGDNQQVFFGLGAGAIGIFGTPDWATLFSSASFWPETANDRFVQFTNRSEGMTAEQTFLVVPVTPFDPGVHRFRMEFDPTTMLLTGSLDLNYAGGPFVADVTGAPPIDTSLLFAPDGWPGEPSRIWFGGDDGAIFRDLSITVIPTPASWGLALLGTMPVAGAVRRRRR